MYMKQDEEQDEGNPIPKKKKARLDVSMDEEWIEKKKSVSVVFLILIHSFYSLCIGGEVCGQGGCCCIEAAGGYQGTGETPPGKGLWL